MKMKSPFATQGKNTHTLAVHCSGILACIAKSPTLEHHTHTQSVRALRSRKYQYVYRFYARMGISK